MKDNKKRIKKIISSLLIMTISLTVVNIMPAEVVSKAEDIVQSKSVEESNNDSELSFTETLNEESVKGETNTENSDVLKAEKDSDDDGLSDGMEELFKTDPQKKDTDEDGLDDALEIKSGLNPLEKDTDKNGVNDGNEDSDNDGLSNAEEVILGTNPLEQDTDGDGINDGEEVNKGISPLQADTDGDGIYDGDEIKLGLDPNKAFTDGITKDSERKIGQTLSRERISSDLFSLDYDFRPYLTAEVSGLLDRKIFINRYDITPIENIKGILNGAVNITSNYIKDAEMNLRFNYSSYLNKHNEEEIDDLVICQYENNEFKILDTEKNNENQSISAKINKIGVYFILDLNEHYKSEVSEKKIKTCNLETSLARAVYVNNSDSDYDGIEDSQDLMSNNNNFSGELKTPYAKSKVSYTMDYRNFFAENKQYNSNISTISSLFSTVIYNGSTYDGLSLNKFMEQHGIKDIKTYKLSDLYKDSDITDAYIGHKKVTYNGETKEIIVIVIRGTNSSIEEWESNFDIGNTDEKSKYADWKVTNNHKGFDVAATRILKCLLEYESKSYIDKSAKKTYWTMGHSRGGGIANILGARLDEASKDVYCYTFAAPNTTTTINAENTTSYPGIYNILNKDDFVPYLPVTQWGFKHYGKSYVKSIADNYEKEWESLTGIWDYNPDTYGMDDTINKIAGIMDNRNEAYTFNCKCHGNNKRDDITVRNYGMSKDSREKAIAKIPENALPYCEITRYNGGRFYGWDFTVCQQPEYFMQTLAALMGGKISPYRFAIELDTAKRYQDAKMGIIRSAIGGIEHPHYPESYYLLAQHV